MKTYGSITRRDFLVTTGLVAAAGMLCRRGLADIAEAHPPHEAEFYETLGNDAVRCRLCPWQCVVPSGKRGHCRVRENRAGRYYSLNYGYPVAMNMDPIEKKPFFHVYPGSQAFSIATVGCNIECKFCQNWDISQARPEESSVEYQSPDEIAKRALEKLARTVAYTYSEPTVFFEYMCDCARAAKAAGLGNVVVSNGFIAAEPLKKMIPLMTAVKIDLKSFTQQFYGDVCSGQLQPVLDTLKRLKDGGVWFEIVNLLIPTLNDNMDDIKRLAAWIMKDLGPDVPLFFTRYHPCYKIRNLPPTPAETVTQAGAIARAEGLHFVYAGNLPGVKGENTYCPKCGAAVVTRYGFFVKSSDLKAGKCQKCGTAIPGVWG
jgi:pyruvate formate lyase activating enzyme